MELVLARVVAVLKELARLEHHPDLQTARLDPGPPGPPDPERRMLWRC